jgi:hypothetical protein
VSVDEEQGSLDALEGSILGFAWVSEERCVALHM